jgi:hypothetical protein
MMSKHTYKSLRVSVRETDFEYPGIVNQPVGNPVHQLRIANLEAHPSLQHIKRSDNPPCAMDILTTTLVPIPQ